MNYRDLREMCERYGLQVNLDISGQWAMEDGEPGAGYRLYVWEVLETGSRNPWPMRVLGRIGLGKLRDMSYADMERIVVGCSVEAMGDGN